MKGSQKIQEEKKESTLLTKKATKKKRKSFLFFLIFFLVESVFSFFSYFLVFFYKFPPQVNISFTSNVRIVGNSDGADRVVWSSRDLAGTASPVPVGVGQVIPAAPNIQMF